MKRRTLRGLLDSSELRQLIVDDGQLTQGYRVTRFDVFPYVPAGGSQITAVVLGLDYDMDPNFNASDNRQIGWASNSFSSIGASISLVTSALDPDHVIIRDLWILNTNPGDQVNYLIELETVELSSDQTILTLIKERSQDDSR